jgi:hypothetical protein
MCITQHHIIMYLLFISGAAELIELILASPADEAPEVRACRILGLMPPVQVGDSSPDSPEAPSGGRHHDLQGLQALPFPSKLHLGQLSYQVRPAALFDPHPTFAHSACSSPHGNRRTTAGRQGEAAWPH